MPAQPANLTPWAHGGLALMCLLLVASVTGRVYAYRHLSEGDGLEAWDVSGAPVDLGGGVLLPRSAARHHVVTLAFCPAPASVDFVAASPYGSDPSLVGAPHPDDHVFYVYRGWNLGSRAAAIGLNALYFARRAYARLAMQKVSATDDLAVKIIVPAGCDVGPDTVMSVLRSTLQPMPSFDPAAAPHP